MLACNYILTYQDVYSIEQNIYSQSDMLELKFRERSLIERNETGYYRCKKLHSELYAKLKAAYAPYITTKISKMLNHKWTTQKNEAMNQSVASYALQNILYSNTDSLLARISIAGGTQIAGYSRFWNTIFASFNIPMDTNLEYLLSRRNNIK